MFDKKEFIKKIDSLHAPNRETKKRAREFINHLATVDSYVPRLQEVEAGNVGGVLFKFSNNVRVAIEQRYVNTSEYSYTIFDVEVYSTKECKNVHCVLIELYKIANCIWDYKN